MPLMVLSFFRVLDGWWGLNEIGLLQECESSEWLISDSCLERKKERKRGRGTKLCGETQETKHSGVT